MEYSNFFIPQRFFPLEGIWNIPSFFVHNVFSGLLEYGIFQTKTATTKLSKILEYGIFQEYSKKMVHNQNVQKFGIWNIPWNIPGIFHNL